MPSQLLLLCFPLH